DRRACRSSRGLCNLVDYGPVDAVLGAQRVGLAAPLCADAPCRQPVQKPRRRQRKTGCDQYEKLRLLTLCLPVVIIAAEPEESSDEAIAHPVEEHQTPAKSRRRNAQRCKGVPRIVLAVAERALPVLPRFPPMYRGEAHEEGALGKRCAELAPRRRVENRPSLESVLLGCVVVHGGCVAEPIDRRQNRIPLGRMEISARGVRAEGPRRIVEALPRRQRQRVPEKKGDRLQR